MTDYVCEVCGAEFDDPVLGADGSAWLCPDYGSKYIVEADVEEEDW